MHRGPLTRLEDARAAVLEALPNAVRRGLTASEIMSRPARFVSVDDTVAHAMVLCQRHRQSGMLVGEPDRLVAELAEDEAVAAADTLLLTIPNQLGVDYNVHVLDSVLRHLAPELGWR